MSDTLAASDQRLLEKSRPRAGAQRTPSTRERRGLALFHERGSGIVRIAPHTYRIPSARTHSVYFTTIKAGEESCTCPDYLQNGTPQALRGGSSSLPPEDAFYCKHMFAALIWRAKSGECFGCGAILLRRELYEVMDFHESLTFFEGDELCEECAMRHGLL